MSFPSPLQHLDKVADASPETNLKAEGMKNSSSAVFCPVDVGAAGRWACIRGSTTVV